MDVTGVAVLLLFMFHVAQSEECNDHFIFSTAGGNVSLEWRVVNKSSVGYRTASFVIFDSSAKRIAEMRGQECNVADHISTFCNISDHDSEIIAYLTILNVSARHSGIYTLHLKMGLVEKGNSSKKLVVIGES
ncbi:hypothetical protein CHS0354_038646 [Potamilus streckersoni]|uniref:Uncharacterized protein n=1 Tax=Potamilus streckersoni TaxID=2493646 RepID=A0AAE0T8E5_9BIVA|nr:hypothetical protein CHS0354_038646 [Potamilus streckersoni]